MLLCVHVNWLSLGIIIIIVSTVMTSTNDPEQLAFQHAHSQDNRSSGTIAAQVVCLTIAFAGVSLRFKARRLAKAKILIDDHFILLSLV